MIAENLVIMGQHGIPLMGEYASSPLLSCLGLFSPQLLS